jgi:peptidoglycan/LPS O-acetylase OafA/YrhL
VKAKPYREGSDGRFMLNYLSAGKALHSDKYRPDIDGIRSIAVCSVVFCHAFPNILPGSFVGVDIFFVISAYLIFSILIKDFDKNSFSIWHFYNRRIKRIFPALIAMLLFTMLFGWFCLFKSEYILLGRHISASALFSENFLLWSERF